MKVNVIAQPDLWEDFVILALMVTMELIVLYAIVMKMEAQVNHAKRTMVNVFVLQDIKEWNATNVNIG